MTVRHEHKTFILRYKRETIKIIGQSIRNPNTENSLAAKNERHKIKSLVRFIKFYMIHCSKASIDSSLEMQFGKHIFIWQLENNIRFDVPFTKRTEKQSCFICRSFFFFFIRRAKFKYSVDNLIEVLNNKNAFLIHSERCYIVHYTYELKLWKRHTSTLGDETASRNGMGRIGMGQFFFCIYIAGSGQRAARPRLWRHASARFHGCFGGPRVKLAGWLKRMMNETETGGVFICGTAQ